MRSSATCSRLARSDIEPFFGVSTRTGCGFTSASGYPTLVCGNFLASPGQSQAMLLGELGAFGKRLGRPRQG